jgi:hypothetical protein
MRAPAVGPESLPASLLGMTRAKRPTAEAKPELYYPMSAISRIADSSLAAEPVGILIEPLPLPPLPLPLIRDTGSKDDSLKALSRLLMGQCCVHYYPARTRHGREHSGVFHRGVYDPLLEASADASKRERM